MAEYLPIFLRVDEQRCIVVGGGKVALRKARLLAERNARVLVIDPSPCKAMFDLDIDILCLSYAPMVLEGAVLVIAATNKTSLNRRVYEDAVARGIPVNVVDDPDHCSFIVPSIAQKGLVQIAVSTGGASPSAARWLRGRIESGLTDDVTGFVEAIATLRRELRDRGVTGKNLRDVMVELASDAGFEIYQERGMSGLRDRLEKLMG